MYTCSLHTSCQHVTCPENDFSLECHNHQCTNVRSSGQNSNRYPIGVIYRSRWVDRRYLTQSPYVTTNGNVTTFVKRSKNLSARCGVAAIYAQKYQICQLKCCHTRAASSQRFHSVQKKLQIAEVRTVQSPATLWKRSENAVK